jgi:hypothetical protein
MMTPIRYPQFFKAAPVIFGFEVADLFILAISFNLMGQFNFSLITSLAFCSVIFALRKIFKRYIDFTSLRYRLNRPTHYLWADEVERLKGERQ